VSGISLSFLWNISHSKKNSAKYYHKGMLILMETARNSFQILIKLEFS